MTANNRIYHINKVCDGRGTLAVASLDGTALPFTPGRVFWITDVPAASRRGGHAHRTCHELLFVLAGAFTLTIDDGERRESIRMEKDTGRGVAIWAGEWCELTDFEVGTVVVVLANEDYSPEGYIHSHEEFCQWRKKGFRF